MKSWIKILIIVVIVGILAAVGGYVFVYNKPHTNYEKAKPDISIMAADLYSAFVNDQHAAEQTYNGKVIQITGALDSVESTEEITYAVFSFSDGMFGSEGIRCSMLDAYNQEVRNIKPGSLVTIKGYCTGYSGLDVILEFCSLINQ
jgi:hypothetical protein